MSTERAPEDDALASHAAEARRQLAEIVAAASRARVSGERADLIALDRARSLLETAIGSMRVLVIAALRPTDPGE
jgi:hypothetical protein